VDSYYHVAVIAWHADGLGLKSACIKCSPDEDIAVGAEKFARLYFSDAEGWSHHKVQYGRIADDIIALERFAAHAEGFAPEHPIKTTVLYND
jgi:hypothetical protein